MITASTASVSPFLGEDRLHRGVALGAQHILHLHRFDDAQRLAGLHFLTDLDGDRLDEARHRAEQRRRPSAPLAQPSARQAPPRDAYRREPRPRCRRRRSQTVEDRAHLHRDSARRRSLPRQAARPAASRIQPRPRGRRRTRSTTPRPPGVDLDSMRLLPIVTTRCARIAPRELAHLPGDLALALIESWSIMRRGNGERRSVSPCGASG